MRKRGKAEAERRIRLLPKYGVKMKIASEEFCLSGFPRQPRLKYRIQCKCGFVFTCWADKERARCPIPECGYSALIRILRRDWEEE